MLGNSDDPIVDANCRENGLVLITHNYKHFRKIAKDLASGGHRLKRLHRIDMECHQSVGPRRLKEALSLIETEWQAAGSRGLQISIGECTIRVHR
jgi:hypothetical protein